MTDRARESGNDKNTKTRNTNVVAKAQREAAENVAASSTRGAEPMGALLQRAQVAPGTISPGDGKRLQGALGNQNPAPNAAVQPKLTVGAVNDPLEMEADRVADQVMQSANDSAQVGGDGSSGAAPSISRMTASSAQRAESGAEPGGAFEANDGLQQQLSRSHGGGSPLPDELRRKFEPAFGADFGGVRVHTGGDSAQMSNSIQAKAFTHGNDIHFNQGVYDPNSSAGQRLVAHELTHVVQQGAATQSPVAQRKAATSFAVQRSPFGIIQRTNQKVSALVAFWEEQKKLNAPNLLNKGGGAPPKPAPQPQSVVASGAGGGGSVFDAPSGGGALVTPSGGGSALNSKTPTGKSDSSSWLNSSTGSTVKAQTPVGKGVQFPDTTKYMDRLQVHSEYDDEDTDSTHFMLSKVFQVTEDRFFNVVAPDKRKAALLGIGWSESDVAELEATHKTKVQYVKDDNDRAEYALKLGATITQGTGDTVFDTKDMFANGVGQGHAIFVMDPNGTFYAGRHKVALFHHSSFLAGGKATAAGTIKVNNGKLEHITAKSGHYQPKRPQMMLALAELKERGVSLGSVRLQLLDNSGKLEAEENAEFMLNIWGPKQGGSSPASISNSSTTPPTTTPPSSSVALNSSSGGGGGFMGGGSFEGSELIALEMAGASNWKDKLLSLGLQNSGGKNWTFQNWHVDFDGLLAILRGSKQPQDFVFD